MPHYIIKAVFIYVPRKNLIRFYLVSMSIYGMRYPQYIGQYGIFWSKKFNSGHATQNMPLKCIDYFEPKVFEKEQIQ